MDTFDDYFSDCNESTIKENYVIVYEVSMFKTDESQIQVACIGACYIQVALTLRALMSTTVDILGFY